MTTSKSTPRRRTLIGTVVSDRMDKTRVVSVERQATHPVYGKQYHTSQTFKAHDPQNAYHTGDRVVLEETRPLSRGKRWRILKKLGAQTEAAS